MKNRLFLILSKKNQKLITLVDFLVNQQRWCKIAEVADFLGLSIRSTQRLLNELEDTFTSYNSFSTNTLSLMFTKNNGVKLVTTNGLSSFWSFIRYITIYDTTFQLARAIFFSTFSTTVKFAEEYNVSIASVKYYLTKIQAFCLSLGVSLSTTTYEVIGSEESLRIINYSITWFLNRGVFWPVIYKRIDETKLIDTIDHLTQQHLGYKIIPVKKKKLAYFIANNLLRIHQKKYILLQPEWKTFFDENSDGIVQIVQEFYQKYHIHNEAEIYFLSVYLQSESRLFQGIDTNSDVLSIHKQNQTIIYQLTHKFCDFFSAEIIYIPEQLKADIFQQAFFTHLNCSIAKVNDYFGYDTILFEENMELFPLLTNKLSIFIEKLYSLTKNKIFTNREVLLRAYMTIYATIKDLPLYEPPIYLYLETDLPYTEEVYIKNYLIKKFHNTFNLSFVESVFTKKPDVILSSISIATESEKYCQIKLSANLQEPLTSGSMLGIEAKLRQLTQKIHSNNNTKEDNSLLNLLD